MKELYTINGKPMYRHYLKCWPKYFKAIEDGAKNFEIRKDDRGFNVGDKLTLKEWNPDTGAFTGKCIDFTIGYILRDAPEFGLTPGYCILSLTIKHS